MLTYNIEGFLRGFSFFYQDLFIFIPDIFWINSIIILLLFSIFFSKNIKSLYISYFIIDLSIPIIIFSFFFNYIFFNLDFITIFTLKVDNFSIFFKILILLFLLFCILTSKYYFFFDKIYIYEYSILLLLSIEGSTLMIMTNNLFLFYLALEIQNLCFYVLASLKRYSNFSTEAGLKYFLLGTFSSSILLFGISLLYGILGTLDLFEIKMLLNNVNYLNFILLVSFFFFISGLLFKIGSIPFHYWVPDVYEGSPTIVTMVFSIIPKIVLVFFYGKLFFYIFTCNLKFFGLFLFICGILSIIIGMVYAMYQFKIKRFLAYSSIVNVGFMLVAFSNMTFDGIFSGLFFIFCYLFSVSLMFFLLINLRKDNLKEINMLFELSLFKNNIFILLAYLFIFLSFAGIPPLIGFFGKFFIFFSIFNSFNYFILIMIFFCSVISSFYYLRVIRFLFFTKVKEHVYYYYYFNYSFIFFLLFNLFFLLFFDFFGEFFYFFLIKTFFLY